MADYIKYTEYSCIKEETLSSFTKKLREVSNSKTFSAKFLGNFRDWVNGRALIGLVLEKIFICSIFIIIKNITSSATLQPLRLHILENKDSHLHEFFL